MAHVVLAQYRLIGGSYQKVSGGPEYADVLRDPASIRTTPAAPAPKPGKRWSDYRYAELHDLAASDPELFRRLLNDHRARRVQR